MNNTFAFLFNKKLNYGKNDFKTNKYPIYQSVEKLFYDLNLDRKNFLKSSWNPLGEFISPGNKIVIKPNFVATRDREYSLSDEELFSVSTSPHILKPIIDYALKALKGKGEISIIDSPIEGTDFNEVLTKLGIFDLLKQYENSTVPINIIDLRDFTFSRSMLCDDLKIGKYSLSLGLLLKRNIQGDPKGYKIIDLKNKSFFSDSKLNFNLLRFHRANPKTPIKHHSYNKNEYSISQSVLDADVIINIPKLKTHKKSGVTLCLKSVIGLTNRKHWLPHYRSGLPPAGDEYPKNQSIREKIQQKLSRFPLPFGHSLIFNLINKNFHHHVVSEGSWTGNDTLYRVILDLNRILLFADKKGNMANKQQRKLFCLVDGIVGGEGDGPLRPVPKKSGLLTGGFNPVLVDALTVHLMGFNWRYIKQITEGLSLFNLSREKIETIINNFSNNCDLNLEFKPPTGWEKIIRS